MRSLTKVLAVTAAAAGILSAPATIAGDKASGEEKLAKLLEGRVAGEPDSCINTYGSAPLTIIDGTAIVYKSGNTVWVNRTEHPDSLDDGDTLVIRKFNATSLCRQDTVTTIDRFGGFYTGNVFLTDFVPYTKAS